VVLKEVIGWPTVVTPEGTNIYLGDVYAGQRTKLIARVGIPATYTGNRVLNAKLAYTDLVTGDAGRAIAPVQAMWTTDEATVVASAQEGASVTAINALSAGMLKSSAEAYASGDVQQANVYVARSKAILAEAAEAWGDDEFKEQQQALDANARVYNDVAPTSTVGRHAVKKGKEMSRGWTH
jgi:hypothetical protein